MVLERVHFIFFGFSAPMKGPLPPTVATPACYLGFTVLRVGIENKRIVIKKRTCSLKKRPVDNSTNLDIFFRPLSFPFLSVSGIVTGLLGFQRDCKGAANQNQEYKELHFAHV